jgi:hypothetical protein
MLRSYETSAANSPKIASSHPRRPEPTKNIKTADFQVKIRPAVFPNTVRHAERLDHDGRQAVTAPPPTRITATRKGSNFG